MWSTRSLSSPSVTPMGVAEAAFGIAETMGLPADRIQLVRRAALLHDIGKLSVSNAILDKKACSALPSGRLSTSTRGSRG